MMWKLRLGGWEGASHRECSRENIPGRGSSKCIFWSRNKVVCENPMEDQCPLRKPSGARYRQLWTDNGC